MNASNIGNLFPRTTKLRIIDDSIEDLEQEEIDALLYTFVNNHSVIVLREATDGYYDVELPILGMRIDALSWYYLVGFNQNGPEVN